MNEQKSCIILFRSFRFRFLRTHSILYRALLCSIILIISDLQLTMYPYTKYYIDMYLLIIYTNTRYKCISSCWNYLNMLNKTYQ